MASSTVRVRGLREFQRALAKADKAQRKEIRATFKEVGEVVRADAASRFGRIDAGSAAGYRVRVRQRGVSVEQSRRRVTGKRADYGALQMRLALIPAGKEKEPQVVQAFEKALDRIGDILDG